MFNVIRMKWETDKILFLYLTKNNVDMNFWNRKFLSASGLALVLALAFILALALEFVSYSIWNTVWLYVSENVSQDSITRLCLMSLCISFAYICIYIYIYCSSEVISVHVCLQKSVMWVRECHICEIWCELCLYPTTTPWKCCSDTCAGELLLPLMPHNWC